MVKEKMAHTIVRKIFRASYMAVAFMIFGEKSAEK
jgi:hypothetical protein